MGLPAFVGRPVDQLPILVRHAALLRLCFIVIGKKGGPFSSHPAVPAAAFNPPPHWPYPVYCPQQAYMYSASDGS